MKDSVIFYWSGTGNSLQVAKDIAAGLGDTELIHIGGFDLGTKIEAKRVGIVFPVYCWGPPFIVAEFADKMKVSAGTYLFAVATYGGICGAALKMLKEHLDARKLALSAAYSIKMPGNFIASYGAMSEKTQQKCFAKEKTAVPQITAEIKSGAENLKAAKLNPVATALTNNIYHKFMDDCHNFDKGFNVNGSCTGCGTCEKVCPVGNITLEAGKPVWHHKCEECVACIQHCPQKAINYKDKTQNRKRYVNPNV